MYLSPTRNKCTLALILTQSFRCILLSSANMYRCILLSSAMIHTLICILLSSAIPIYLTPTLTLTSDIPWHNTHNSDPLAYELSRDAGTLIYYFGGVHLDTAVSVP